jgi:hypothetical protein
MSFVQQALGGETLHMKALLLAKASLPGKFTDCKWLRCQAVKPCKVHVEGAAFSLFPHGQMNEITPIR